MVTQTCRWIHIQCEGRKKRKGEKRKREEKKKWCTLLISSLGKQRQADLYDFKARMVYTSSSRPARDRW